MIGQFWLGLIVGVIIGVGTGLPAGLMLRESRDVAAGREDPTLPTIRKLWHDYWRAIVLSIAIAALLLAGFGLVGLAIAKGRADTAVEKNIELGTCVAGFQQNLASANNQARAAAIKSIRSEEKLWRGLQRQIASQTGSLESFNAKIERHVSDLQARLDTYREHPTPPPDLCADLAERGSSP